MPATDTLEPFRVSEGVEELARRASACSLHRPPPTSCSSKAFVRGASGSFRLPLCSQVHYVVVALDFHPPPSLLSLPPLLLSPPTLFSPATNGNRRASASAWVLSTTARLPPYGYGDLVSSAIRAGRWQTHARKPFSTTTAPATSTTVFWRRWWTRRLSRRRK